MTTRFSSDLVESLLVDITKSIYQTADNWEDFVDVDGELNVDTDGVLERAIEKVIDEVPSSLVEKYVEAFIEHPKVIEALAELPQMVEEIAKDAMEYHRAMSGTVGDQLAYYGMSTKDFL